MDSISKDAIITPYTFSNGFTLTLAYVPGNEVGGPGVKLELSAGRDESAIILPPEQAIECGSALIQLARRHRTDRRASAKTGTSKADAHN